MANALKSTPSEERSKKQGKVGRPRKHPEGSSKQSNETASPSQPKKKLGDGKPLSEEERKLRIQKATRKSKERALKLLERSLVSRRLEITEQDSLIDAVSLAFGLGSRSSKKKTSADDENIAANAATSAAATSAPESSKRSVSRKPSKKEEEIDNHNEMCHVCDVGGKLICCDECTLVFHLECVRPKLQAIPKGDWSCAYCVLARSQDENICRAAKKAIRRMKRLQKGLASDDDGDDIFAETSMVRAANKFVLRQSNKNQIVEIGRYNSMEEALTTLMNSKPSSSMSAKKGGSDDEDDTKKLWCTYCLDDKNITICAFCGCRNCFGKHDDDMLILCDGCDKESHMYCLDPQLTRVPTKDWFCKKCKDAGIGNSTPSQDKKSKKRRDRANSTISSSCSVSSSASGFISGHPSSKSSSPSSSSPLHADKQHNKGNSNASCQPFFLERPPDKKRDACSAKNAMSIISQRFLFNDDDLQLLKDYREWAPRAELSSLLDAIKTQKSILLNEIRLTEPGYILPTIFSAPQIDPWSDPSTLFGGNIQPVIVGGSIFAGAGGTGTALGSNKTQGNAKKRKDKKGDKGSSKPQKKRAKPSTQGSGSGSGSTQKTVAATSAAMIASTTGTATASTTMDSEPGVDPPLDSQMEPMVAASGNKMEVENEPSFDFTETVVSL